MCDLSVNLCALNNIQESVSVQPNACNIIGGARVRMHVFISYPIYISSIKLLSANYFQVGDLPSGPGENKPKALNGAFFYCTCMHTAL